MPDSTTEEANPEGVSCSGSYAAQWQNEHPKPKNDGWWWYWHPDIRYPAPIRVVFSHDPADYGWKYIGCKYPAEDKSKEWWMPMGYGPEGPEPPSAA